MAKGKKVSKKSKGKKKIHFDKGVVHIKSSFNNTIVTVTDSDGNVVTWASGGTIGYKGTKKGTPYAAQLAATKVAKEIMDMGLNKIAVEVKGPGSGREAAIRSLQAAGLEVLYIKDVTPIPHNGCRPKKKKNF
ncbi:MAG: 30S ribosomal protein S11 [Thermotoga sp.]|nr:30S ribosomal protein S11 [Thermotogota bacterium]RKX54179.1 MAG: 30S ribosomal protein S11 [Thermotoga sp.]